MWFINCNQLLVALKCEIFSRITWETNLTFEKKRPGLFDHLIHLVNICFAMNGMMDINQTGN